MRVLALLALLAEGEAWVGCGARVRGGALLGSLRDSILAGRNGSRAATVAVARPSTEGAFRALSTSKRTRVAAGAEAGKRAEPADELELGEQPGPFRSGFVSIIGNPNVGKSTLLNALLGERLSIVSPKPQTTRHRILGVLSEPGHQIVFSDTPGMLAPAYALQEAMMDSVRGAASDADVVLVVTDVFGEPLADARLRDKLLVYDRPVLVLVNKLDLVERVPVLGNATALTATRRPRRPSAPVGEGEGDGLEQERFDQPRTLEALAQLWRTRIPRAEVLGISAAHNYGVDALKARLVAMLPQGPRYYPSDTLTNRDERFFAAEIVREALFGLYQEEVPYSCEVVIGAFTDKGPGLSVIEAFVVVDRDSQKAIVIGKGGEKLKALGTAARLRLEEFLGRKVFLSLFVRVEQDWRRNPEALAKFGYTDSDFG